MRVIRPLTINDTTLSSSTVAEPDTGEIVWVASTRLTGDRRISTVTHRVYEVVATTSTTDDPVEGVNATPPSWVDVGPTNKWAMFDTVNSTTTKEATSLVIETEMGRITNSIAGFAVSASTVNITVTDTTEGEVFNRDLNMTDNSQVGGWYDYYSAPIIRATSFVVLDLPAYPLATVKITAEAASVEFGNLVIGNSVTLGTMLAGTSLQLLDYSRKVVDDFGNTTVQKGRSSKLVNFNLSIPYALTDYVFNTFGSLQGFPSAWIGDGGDGDPTLVFGYYKDYRNNLTTRNITDATVTVEGLV